MYKLRLAIRYLFKRRISWLAVAAVALCVFMVVVVMTVMSGLVSEFKDKNHRFIGDCIVSTPSLVGFPFYDEFMARLDTADFAEAAAPVITSWAILNPKNSDESYGAEIMGIDPNRHCRVTDFADALYYHHGDCRNAFTVRNFPARSGIVFGIDKVSMRNELGGYTHSPTPPLSEFAVSCFPLSAKGSLTKYATGFTNTRLFYFSDDAQTGLPKPDTRYVYIRFDDLQSLCGMATGQKRATAIYIKFKPGIAISSGTARVSAMWKECVVAHAKDPSSPLLANVRVQEWKDYARDMIAPLEKEQTMMTMLFCLVGLITVFIIFVIFYMIVTAKTKDIGVIKSLGAAAGDIMQIFLMVAGMIGVIGAAIGGFGAMAFLSYINRIESFLFEHFGFQLWSRAMYAIEAIPNSLNAKVLAIIFSSTILACLIGAFLPAMRASRRRPVETLQVNQL